MSLNSFRHAIRGVWETFRTESSFRVMLVCLPLVILASWLLKLTKFEWMAVLFCSAGVLALEMVNTAIESTLDMITEDHHHLAKKAKDAAAGAVFVWSIFSAVMGLVIFVPKLIGLFD